MRSELLALAVALATAAGSPAGPEGAGARATERASTVAAAGAPPPRAEFRPAAPGYAWSFPRDHFTHPGYRTEWWYFTGRLAAQGEPRREVGYQLTFFRVGLLPGAPAVEGAWAATDLVMVHAAVTDLAAGRHIFSEVLWRAAPALGGFAPPPRDGQAAPGGPRTVAWARAPAGSEGRWTLELDGEAWSMSVRDATRGLAFALTARPERPLVFQGPGGLSRKSSSEGFASLYYSFPRMATEGTVRLRGADGREEDVPVRGTSWMDREIGSSQLAPSQVGWDWFALRLADGRDLMLYLLRRADGAVDFARGTLVGTRGEVRWLAAGELVVRATAAWKSPATGAAYPSRWAVEVPSAGIVLEVQPELADQENRAELAGGIFYWEGAVRLRDAAGRPAGEGYVELTGYGEKSRPPI